MGRELDKIVETLGSEADSLLNHTCSTIDKKHLHLPGPDFVDRVIAISDRNPQVMRSMQGCLTMVGWVARAT